MQHGQEAHTAQCVKRCENLIGDDEKIERRSEDERHSEHMATMTRARCTGDTEADDRPDYEGLEERSCVGVVKWPPRAGGDLEFRKTIIHHSETPKELSCAGLENKCG